VLAVLVRRGFPAQRFGIEITEDAIIADAENTRRVIESFKNQGAKIALDDFGTGYSSLQHLRSLPFDRIKIDRSFVRDMSSMDGDAIKIVRAIISLAHSLDLQVTAEGIETEAHAAVLRKLGCNQGQGFHFGRPQADIVTIEDAALLRKEALR
jgi:EAL domain-containing protein (putative c-di-GMP-specific phosphodiesterase class I)